MADEAMLVLDCELTREGKGGGTLKTEQPALAFDDRSTKILAVACGDAKNSVEQRESTDSQNEDNTGGF